MSDENEKRNAPEDRDRRFRRYHRARARRVQQAKDDANFFRAVYSLAGVGGAMAIGLAVLGMTGGRGVEGMDGLAQPWIGPVTKLEALGLAFIAMLAVIFFWRIRKRR